MASEAGWSSQDTAYARDIQEVLNELCQMQPFSVVGWPRVGCAKCKSPTLLLDSRVVEFEDGV